MERKNWQLHEKWNYNTQIHNIKQAFKEGNSNAELDVRNWGNIGRYDGRNHSKIFNYFFTHFLE